MKIIYKSFTRVPLEETGFFVELWKHKHTHTTDILLPSHFIWLNMNKGVFSNAVTLNDHFNINTMYAPYAVAICQLSARKRLQHTKWKERIVKASTDCLGYKVVNAHFGYPVCHQLVGLVGMCGISWWEKHEIFLKSTQKTCSWKFREDMPHAKLSSSVFISLGPLTCSHSQFKWFRRKSRSIECPLGNARP